MDYLRSKAKEMTAKRIYTREVVPTALTGSILSLCSISTANFETAEEDLWFSDGKRVIGIDLRAYQVCMNPIGL